MDDYVTNYYETVSCADSLDLCIKWNVSQIAGHKDASGIILQRMDMNSHIPCLRSILYWEIWEVVDGNVLGNEYGYDDKWSALPSLLICDYEDEIGQSSDGVVKFTSKVYWIPLGCNAYKEIIKWDVGAVSEASELKSSVILASNVDQYYVCDRSYEWNYKDILHRLKGGDNFAIHNSR